MQLTYSPTVSYQNIVNHVAIISGVVLTIVAGGNDTEWVLNMLSVFFTMFSVLGFGFMFGGLFLTHGHVPTKKICYRLMLLMAVSALAKPLLEERSITR